MGCVVALMKRPHADVVDADRYNHWPRHYPVNVTVEEADMLDELNQLMTRRGVSLMAAAEKLGLCKTTLFYLIHDRHWPKRVDREVLTKRIENLIQELKTRPRIVAVRGEIIMEVDAMERLSVGALDRWGLERDPFVNEIEGIGDLYRTDETDRTYRFMEQIARHQGFGAVVGEVGTGKTILLRRLQEECGESVRFVQVMNTDKGHLTPIHVMEAIIYDLRGKDSGAGRSKEQMARYVKNLLADAAKEDKRVCLVLDDAQQAPRQTLRSLKQLWDYNFGFRKGLGILLLGQLELLDAMRDVRLRETTNRCATFLMRGLVHPNQVKGYLKFKFSRIGADVERIVDDEAIKAIAHHAKFEFVINGEKIVAGPPLRVQNITARVMNKADELGEGKVTAEVVGLIAK